MWQRLGENNRPLPVLLPLGRLLRLCHLLPS
jgi:hypothetical protein